MLCNGCNILFTLILQLENLNHLKSRMFSRDVVDCTCWVYEATFIVNENVMSSGIGHDLAQTIVMLF